MCKHQLYGSCTLMTWFISVNRLSQDTMSSHQNCWFNFYYLLILMHCILLFSFSGSSDQSQHRTCTCHIILSVMFYFFTILNHVKCSHKCYVSSCCLQYSLFNYFGVQLYHYHIMLISVPMSPFVTYPIFYVIYLIVSLKWNHNYTMV